MCRVAYRAGESGIDVKRVLAEARIRHDVIQVMALRAQRIRSSRGWVDDRRQLILYSRSRTRRGRQARGHLAELVTPLQNMRELRAVRPVRPGAAEFAIVVAIMTVGAKNARCNRTPRGAAIQIPHELKQAWLRQPTLALGHDRMARFRRDPELRNQIQFIAARRRPYRSVPERCQYLFARARAVAAQTSLVLVEGRIHLRNSIRCTNADRSGL